MKTKVGSIGLQLDPAPFLHNYVAKNQGNFEIII